MRIGMQASEDQYSAVTGEMKRLMEQVLGPGYRQFAAGESWSPAVNVYEDAVAYHVVVDLAGVCPEEIQLQVEGRTLMLTGERHTPRPPEDQGVECMHLMEIDHGTFCRTVDVPASVHVDQINATYRSGLLWVCLPKHVQS